MALQLRPYQQEAVNAVYAHLRERDDNPCLVLCTGAGKSILIGKIASDAVTQWNGRVLILAHVKELLEQNAGKVKSLCPEIPVGIYSAGLNSKDTKHPVIVAGIQSVYNKACELGVFDLIIVDEAHLIAPDGDGMYRTFLNDMKVINPNVRVIGLTATPYRLKGGLICKPENILNTVCYEVGVKEMIQQGYLSPLITRSGKKEIDLSNLHVRGGEFINTEIVAAMDKEEVTKAACAEIVKLTEDRKSVLIFATSVEHCEHIAERLRYHGQECAIVTGDTPAGERAELLDRFKGKAVPADLLGNMKPPLKFLVNVNVLTTGFDAPNVDCVVLLRPTASPGLLVQMVGRGFRLSPETGKQNCIAEGTMILTDQGLVPIEKVTTQMKLWDGVEFVSHSGAIYKGEQNVIEYAGLTATPDHKVWSEHNWRTHGKCAATGKPISCTGIGGTAIRETDNCFRYGSCQRRDVDSQTPFAVKTQTKVCFDTVSVRSNYLEKLGQCKKKSVRMPYLRQTASCAQMVDIQNRSRKRQMRKSKQPTLCRLRWSRNSFLFQGTDRYGSLAYGTLRLHGQTNANRQNRQQRKLRTGKFENDNAKYQRYEYKASNQNKNASVQAETPRGSVCRLNHLRSNLSRFQRCRDCGTVQQAILQTKRRVWDILNAGPRHRFTANGLLVSNCLVLDYGENILRHGPIDCITVKDKKSGKGGNAPAKKCPECLALIHASYGKCPDCGYEFPPPETTNLQHRASAEGILSGQSVFTDYGVSDVRYSVHRKNGADESIPATMRVDYEIGFYQYKSEWVCPEHSGYARSKFVKWWLERCAENASIPSTAQEAVDAANAGLLAKPSAIRVKKVTGEKFERITSYTLSERPRMREPGEDDVSDWQSNSPADLGVNHDWQPFDDGDEIPF